MKPIPTNTRTRFLIKRFEGIKLTSYKDSGGVWTIGHGSTHGIKEGMTINHLQADNMLNEELERIENALASLITVQLGENEFSAIVSLVYNIGINAFRNSQLLKLINAGDRQGAANQFLRWDHVGGKVVYGLTRRRQIEREIFLTRDPIVIDLRNGK